MNWKNEEEDWWKFTMIKFTYGFNFPISMTDDEEYWCRRLSEMNAYRALIDNPPKRIETLKSVHLQWTNINDYEVEYGIEKNN
tara:strand:+ start:117 stop:365 length:249 start_codon:yes stop_codon:yes gene_type:complete